MNNGCVGTFESLIHEKRAFPNRQSAMPSEIDAKIQGLYNIECFFVESRKFNSDHAWHNNHLLYTMFAKTTRVVNEIYLESKYVRVSQCTNFAVLCVE